MAHTVTRNQLIIVISTIVFLVLFAMSPTFYEWNARGRIHADRYFELVHNFPTDYHLYLSKIRQGKEGSWLAHEKYTSEVHDGSLSQILYVAIGRIAHWNYVQTPYVWFAYHASRVFFAGLLLWVIWKITAWIFAGKGFFWQYMTFLLIAVQSTWPKFELVTGIPRLGGWMPWYTQADSLQRTTFMPHVLFAQMLMIFILWVFSHMTGNHADTPGGFITKKHPGNAVFLGITGLVLGIIFPPGLLFIYAILGLVTVWEFFTFWWKSLGNKKIRLPEMKRWFTVYIFDRIVFGVISAPTAVYFMLLLTEYPWKRLVEFDVLHPTKFSYIEYFMAVGPLMPLGIAGVIILMILRKWGVISRLKYYIAWIAAWLGLLFIFNSIPQQSPTRFTQMVPQVPLGIFTGMMMYEVLAYIKNTLSAGNKKTSPKNPAANGMRTYAMIRNVMLTVPIAIIFLSFASMASSYMWLKDFVDHKLRATIPLVPQNAEVMYPMYDIIEGMVWLQVYTPRNAVVLSGYATGNYIPVYSGNTAFLGHANTVKMEIKQAATGNFYNNRLGEETEMAWIKEQGIGYIFYGYEEREMNGGVEDLRMYYPKLETVYNTPNIKIYKVP